MKPSLLGMFFSGILLLVSVILLIMQYKFLKGVDMLYLTLLFSIAIAIHSVLHMKAEIHYDFNPLEGKWKIVYNNAQ
jgi:hypothetical protein